jgi:hypothetical protein
MLKRTWTILIVLALVFAPCASAEPISAFAAHHSDPIHTSKASAPHGTDAAPCHHHSVPGSNYKETCDFDCEVWLNNSVEPFSDQLFIQKRYEPVKYPVATATAVSDPLHLSQNKAPWQRHYRCVQFSDFQSMFARTCMLRL